jgi:hypothetical protein
MENFLWDWIYAEYAALHPDMQRHADYFGGLFRCADWHVQTEPVCCPTAADLLTPPISRRTREGREQIRERLGIPGHAPLVLVTMGGGAPGQGVAGKGLARMGDVFFVFPGAARTQAPQPNVRHLDYHSGFYHPDLVNAADAVVGKIGYSTLSEVYQAGAPFGYVARPNYRESAPLVAFVQRKMSGAAVPESALGDGTWPDCVPRLLNLPRIDRSTEPRGDEIAARFLLGLR